MRLNSRVYAFFIAIIVAVISTAGLNLFNNIDPLLAIVVFLSSFTTTFFAVFVLLEVMIFREIKAIRELLKNLSTRKSKKTETVKVDKTENPFQEIDREIVDFANRKEMEIEELRQLEAFRREFVANVSHELKTPIFAAQGFVHTLLDGAIDDEKVRMGFLKKAAKSLDGLDLLVKDLLVLSNIETGGIVMNKDYMDLGKLLSDAVDQFSTKAQKKDIQLSLTISADVQDLTVYADWQRIQQVMNNLISNAINYTNERGEVNIDVEDDEDRLCVTVKDSGIGIPAEDVNRIFERFYRVDKSRSRSMGGTGLGLAIVKHIVDHHESEIKVKSVEGKGSEFSFSIRKEESEDDSII